MSLLLTRYPGVTLDVFDKDEPLLWNKERHYKKVHEDPARETFLRLIRFQKPSLLTIDQFVVIGDKALQTVAANVGAIVVDHTWGLYDISSAPEAPAEWASVEPASEGLPAQHLLAARVRVVHPHELSEEEREQFKRQAEDPAQRQSDVADVNHNSLEQYTYGLQRNFPEQPLPAQVLTDIELW